MHEGYKLEGKAIVPIRLAIVCLFAWFLISFASSKVSGGYWYWGMSAVIFLLTRIGHLKGFYKGYLVQGFYVSGIGFIKPKRLLDIHNIDRLEMTQDKEAYFNIVAISKEDKRYPLKRMPNKHPMEEERQRIQNYIKQYPSI